MNAKTFVPLVGSVGFQLRFYFNDGQRLPEITSLHAEAFAESQRIAEQFEVPHAALACLPMLDTNRNGAFWRVILTANVSSREDGALFLDSLRLALLEAGFKPGKQ